MVAGPLTIGAMGLRDGLNRVKCAARLHARRWEWVANGSCEQVNSCSHCGKAQSRTEHNMTGWAYADPDDTASCVMERRCERCRHTERSVRHDPRWQYESAGRCEGQRLCERCGTPCGGRGTRHEWGPWLPDRETAQINPLSLRSSRLVRSCARCAGQDSMR